MFNGLKHNYSRSVFSLVKPALTTWNSKTSKMRQSWHPNLLCELLKTFFLKKIQMQVFKLFRVFFAHVYFKFVC